MSLVIISGGDGADGRNGNNAMLSDVMCDFECHDSMKCDCTPKGYTIHEEFIMATDGKIIHLKVLGEKGSPGGDAGLGGAGGIGGYNGHSNILLCKKLLQIIYNMW